MVTQWDGIEEFLAVAEASSFTVAARKLQVSLSIVSRRVAQLESRLGVKLLNRTTRRVSLTPAGREYLHACRQIVAGLESANAAIQAAPIPRRGHIRIGAVRGYAAEIAESSAIAFLGLHPEVSVEFMVYSRDFDLSATETDIGLLNSQASSPDLSSTLVSQRSFAMGASPAYLKRNGVPASPDDLQSHQCIMSNEPFWVVRDGQVERPLMLSGRLRIHNSISGLIRAAEAGLGLTYFSRAFLEPAFESGTLVPVLEEHWLTDVGTWLVHPYTQNLPPHVQAFAEFLEAEISQREHK